MIVVDSSCLLAILLNEPEKEQFEGIIAGGDRLVVSAVNALEASIVMRSRHGLAGIARLSDLLTAAEIEIVAFDDIQVKAATTAFDRYVKGINPKARLNMGDCAAYALAKIMNAPLLFKGNDFTETDIKAAV